MITTRIIILTLCILVSSIGIGCRNTINSATIHLVNSASNEIISDIIESRSEEDFSIDSLFIICGKTVSLVDEVTNDTLEVECENFTFFMPNIYLIERMPDYNLDELVLPIRDLRFHYFITFDTFRIGKQLISTRVNYGTVGVNFVYDYQINKSNGVIVNKEFIEVIHR